MLKESVGDGSGAVTEEHEDLSSHYGGGCVGADVTWLSLSLQHQ